MSNFIQFHGLFNKHNLPYMNQQQLLYAYFEIRPGAAAANVRLPLNFSLVLDRSGSMYGQKMDQLKQAVKSLIDQLEPTDYISIVPFNSRTTVMAAATTAHDKHSLKRQVDKLSADGGTTMAPAMKAGLAEISKYYGPDKASRLILLTDGQTTGEDDCRRQADEAGRMGIPIIALGLGTDWNEDLLVDLGQRSGQDNARMISNPNDINDIFQEVLTEMKVVAQNLAFRLLLVQGVEARRIWQVAPLIKDISMGAVQGRAVTVDLPELSEAGAAYLVELLVPPRNPGTYRFAQAEVLYDVPTQGLIQQKESVQMAAEVTTNPHLAQQVNGRVMNIVEKVTAFKLQTQALDEAAMGNMAGATRKLRAAHTILLDQGEAELAQNVLAEAQRLEQGQDISSEGRKTMKLQSRKTVKLSDMNLP